MIESYFPSQEKYRVIKSFKNGIDLIEADGHHYVSKIYPVNSDRGRLSFFENLQNFTSEKLGISPFVIKTIYGKTNALTSDGIIELTDYVEGEDFDLNKIKNTGSFFGEVGAFLGKVHRVFEEFALLNPGKPDSLLNYYPESSTHLLDLQLTYEKERVGAFWVEMLAEKRRIVTELSAERNGFQDLPRGIVHGDFYPKNILFDKDMKIIGLIDYAQAGEFFRCYEIIRGLIQTNKFLGRIEIEPEFLAKYLEGYCEHINPNNSEYQKMLDLYIYLQASDISFNKISVVSGDDEDLKSYSKFRFDSLLSLYRNREVLNEVLLKICQKD